MKKIIKRIFATVSLVGLVMVSGVIGLILFPEPLFANKFEYANFRVYSNDEISPEIKTILDHANTLIEKSELYDPDYTYDLFFTKDETFFDALDDALFKKPAAKSTANNVMVKIPVDLSRNLAIGKISKINLTELIAHEMTHCLQLNRYGMLKFNPFSHPAYWKLEGYPEYVARYNHINKPGYTLADEIDRYCTLEKQSIDGMVETVQGHYIPKVYMKGRLIMQYLIDEKNYSYDQILADTRPEETIFAEAIHWRNALKNK